MTATSNPGPGDRPAELARQRDACAVLLDSADAIPSPLESELHAYVRQLDYAMNARVPRENTMTDSDALDALAGILRGPRPDPEMLEAIRDIVRRSGR